MMQHELTYESEYRGLPILPEPEHGNRVEILDAIGDTMDGMAIFVERTFGFFVELRLPWSVGLVNDNHHAEEFIGYLCEYLDIRGIKHSCVGVREQPAPDAQPHFDILVLVDGDRLHSPYHGLLEALDAVWSNLVGTDARGLLAVSIWKEAFEHRYVLNGGVMIPRDGEGSDAAYALLYRRASHMARSISKRWVPEGVESLLDVHARPRPPASQVPVAAVEAAAK